METVHTNECDVIVGAEEIAKEVFGASSFKRRVFHLASKGELPGAFKLGGKLALSRSAHRSGIAQRAASASQARAA